jgi:uncharacterized protein YqiB (DUF1249 family)
MTFDPYGSALGVYQGRCDLPVARAADATVRLLRHCQGVEVLHSEVVLWLPAVAKEEGVQQALHGIPPKKEPMQQPQKSPIISQPMTW